MQQQQNRTVSNDILNDVHGLAVSARSKNVCIRSFYRTMSFVSAIISHSRSPSRHLVHAIILSITHIKYTSVSVGTSLNNNVMIVRVNEEHLQIFLSTDWKQSLTQSSDGSRLNMMKRIKQPCNCDNWIIHGWAPHSSSSSLWYNRNKYSLDTDRRYRYRWPAYRQLCLCLHHPIEHLKNSKEKRMQFSRFSTSTICHQLKNSTILNKKIFSF